MINKKWLKPIIIFAVIIIALWVIMRGINSYLASRAVVLTMEDMITTAKALSSYLIALAVIIILLVVVAIVSIKMMKPLGSLIRGQSLVAAILAIVVIINISAWGHNIV